MELPAVHESRGEVGHALVVRIPRRACRRDRLCLAVLCLARALQHPINCYGKGDTAVIRLETATRKIWVATPRGALMNA